MRSDVEILKRIIEKNPCYRIEAYLFVLEALFYTRKKLKIEKHVTGKQLLDGIKDLALERFGPLAKMVFENWGVKETLDFGHIVFNMVNEKLLSKTDEDKLEDFKDSYDFEEVFEKNYRPSFPSGK